MDWIYLVCRKPASKSDRLSPPLVIQTNLKNIYMHIFFIQTKQFDFNQLHNIASHYLGHMNNFKIHLRFNAKSSSKS